MCLSVSECVAVWPPGGQRSGCSVSTRADGSRREPDLYVWMQSGGGFGSVVIVPRRAGPETRRTHPASPTVRRDWHANAHPEAS